VGVFESHLLGTSRSKHLGAKVTDEFEDSLSTLLGPGPLGLLLDYGHESLHRICAELRGSLRQQLCLLAGDLDDSSSSSHFAVLLLIA